MYRTGHIGAALMGYAPLGAVVMGIGFESIAIGGAILAAVLAMVPDYDQRVPGIAHRGPTHTVQFAILVAGVIAILGGAIGIMTTDLPLLGVVGLALFGGGVGAVTVLSHIAADALTPMGVKPFGDDRHYTADLCRAGSTLGNYILLALGIGTGLVALYLGQGLHALVGG